MEYAELKGEIPLAQIIEALDDNGDGEADAEAWAAVLASADARISDCFGGSLPDRHAAAAAYAQKIFACEIIYRRRGFSGERNPFSGQAAKAEERLRRLSTGEDTPQGEGGGEEFTEDMRTYPSEGIMA